MAEPHKPRKAWTIAVVALVVGLITGFGVAHVTSAPVTLPPAPNWQRAPVMSWSGSPDVQEISVVVWAAYSDELKTRIEVVEQSATTIRLQGWTWTIPYPQGVMHDMIGQPVTIKVMLDADLGDRQVLNADGSEPVRTNP